MNRDFKGIWIPKEIWLSKDLTLQEKVFLVEIDSLDNKEGCFASNAYFAEFFDISKSRVSQVISSLKEKGFIKLDLIYNGKEVEKRVLNILNRGSKYPKGGIEKNAIGYLESCEDNNTINNTINKSVNNAPSQISNEPKKEDFTEEQFLQRWKDARLHYDKKPTHISKLKQFEKINFNEIKKQYSRKEIEQAIQGLFEQKTFPTVRLRPSHFLELEHFEKYLTCFETKEKLFDNNKFKKQVERL